MNAYDILRQFVELMGWFFEFFGFVVTYFASLSPGQLLTQSQQLWAFWMGKERPPLSLRSTSTPWLGLSRSCRIGIGLTRPRPPWRLTKHAPNVETGDFGGVNFGSTGSVLSHSTLTARLLSTHCRSFFRFIVQASGPSATKERLQLVHTSANW